MSCKQSDRKRWFKLGRRTTKTDQDQKPNQPSLSPCSALDQFLEISKADCSAALSSDHSSDSRVLARSGPQRSTSYKPPYAVKEKTREAVKKTTSSSSLKRTKTTSQPRAATDANNKKSNPGGSLRGRVPASISVVSAAATTTKPPTALVDIKLHDSSASLDVDELCEEHEYEEDYLPPSFSPCKQLKHYSSSSNLQISSPMTKSSFNDFHTSMPIYFSSQQLQLQHDTDESSNSSSWSEEESERAAEVEQEKELMEVAMHRSLKDISFLNKNNETKEDDEEEEEEEDSVKNFWVHAQQSTSKLPRVVTGSQNPPAIERSSSAAVMNRDGDDEASQRLAEIEQENEMIELALRLSLHSVSSSVTSHNDDAESRGSRADFQRSVSSASFCSNASSIASRGSLLPGSLYLNPSSNHKSTSGPSPLCGSMLYCSRRDTGQRAGETEAERLRRQEREILEEVLNRSRTDM